MECRGSGGPTVVLVAGKGERADNWSDPGGQDSGVFPQVASFTRVCAYDRPGTSTDTESGLELSRSTAVAQPTSAQDGANDLNALLAVSGEPGPYVLVGHSLGGQITRLYASEYPADVAGMVLVDALSEDLADGLTPNQYAKLKKLNDPSIQGRPAGSEDEQNETTSRQLRASTPVADVPVTVLTADQWPITPAAIASGAFPDFVTQKFSDDLWTAQLAAQDKLAAQFPGATHITKTNATHYIHVDQPQLVTDSIRDVVDIVRAETQN